VIAYDAAGGYFVLGYYYPSSNCAPSLLIGLINMFMMKSRDNGFVANNTRCDTSIPPGQGGCNMVGLCHLNNWYPGQHLVETILLVIAIVSVPVMLFAKPYFLYRRYRRKTVHYRDLNADDVPIVLNGDGGGVSGSYPSVRADVDGDDAEVLHHANNKPMGHGHGDGPIDFSDMMVRQSIHTIEFVLGCISHTASYLRLWALSLAHAQLSDVLWTMVFRYAFALDGYTGAISTYVIFFIFASLSLAILVLMEGLSAFLHALRLHWVEFQSKFYAGDGYAFVPFSFEKILDEARTAEEAQ